MLNEVRGSLGYAKRAVSFTKQYHRLTVYWLVTGLCLIAFTLPGWSEISPTLRGAESIEGTAAGAAKGVVEGLSEGEIAPGAIPIATIEDLQKIGKEEGYPVDGRYSLTGDIDAGVTSTWNSGSGFKPISNFSGQFDGQGHCIRNLFIRGSLGCGLFANIVPGGEVKNTALIHGRISGFFHVGGLAGINLGSISNCSVGLDIYGFVAVGGIAGSTFGGIIERTRFSGCVWGGYIVGGLVGNCSGGSITDCYTNGFVCGQDAVGGLCGLTLDTAEGITRSYSVSAVEAWLKRSGGAIGVNFADIGCTSVFWNTESAGQGESTAGEGKTTAELLDPASYSSGGWDFETVWEMTADSTYPRLRGIDPAPESVTYTLHAVSEGDGTIRGISEESSEWPSHTLITLSAEPAAGQRFIGWHSAVFPSIGIIQNPIQLVMNRDWEMKAVFVAETIAINTIEELQKIGNDTAYPIRASYRITGDLDASVTRTWNKGAGFTAIGPVLGPQLYSGLHYDFHWYPFMGELDGNGHTITGLYIDRTNLDPPATKQETVNFAGMFNSVGKTARIHHLRFADASITGELELGILTGVNSGQIDHVECTGELRAQKSSTENDSGLYDGRFDDRNEYIGGVGGLVGHHVNGTIDACSFTGKITGVGNRIGGITGFNQGGTITQSWSQGEFTNGAVIGGLVGDNTGTITRSYAGGALGNGALDDTVGGLVGTNSGAIVDAFALSRSYSSNVVGGLVGVNQGSVQRSYASGGFVGNPSVLGGLIGASEAGSVLGSFWDQEMLGLTQDPSDPSAGESRPTAAMMQGATFAAAGWDFDTCWAIQEGQSYPYLREAGPSPTGAGYTITTHSEEGGRIHVSPQSTFYSPYTVVTLTPEGQNGRTFSHWTGAGLPAAGWSSETLRLVMDRDWEITGVFLLGTMEVGSLEELQKIGRDPEWPSYGTYQLTTDLDASGTASWNSGQGFLPIGSATNAFTGSFDGQGHSITGLTIHRSSNYTGLFSAVGSRGRIANLTVRGTGSGKNSVGLIAGLNSGMIRNCVVSGSVAGNYVLGGIAGDNTGTIKYCQSFASVVGLNNCIGGIAGYNLGTVHGCCMDGSVYGDIDIGGVVGYNFGLISNSNSVGNVTGNARLGGLAGSNNVSFDHSLYAVITGCYSLSQIDGLDTFDVGGLVGINDSRILDSYASGDIRGGTNAGGLVGTMGITGTISRSYAVGSVYGGLGAGGLIGGSYSGTPITDAFWDSQTTGQSSSAAGIARDTEQLMQASTYLSAGWDFSTVWTIDEGQSYPQLRVFANGACPEAPEEEGEGSVEGATEGQSVVAHPHHADQNADGHISLTELLRVVQFFNMRGYACAPEGVSTEDGYIPGAAGNHDCAPHNSDYQPQNWKLELTEILRLAQFYNMRGYHACPDEGTEDGFCPGA